jgi:hypothetical protein
VLHYALKERFEGERRGRRGETADGGVAVAEQGGCWRKGMVPAGAAIHR